MPAAAASFTRALEQAPNSSRAHAGLGVVALDAGRRDEAIARWRRAVETDRRNFDAMFNLATELVNAGRMAEARPYLELFVRTAPRAFYARDIDRLAPLVR
jgi:Tfp pilus assembly protein PilF